MRDIIFSSTTALAAVIRAGHVSAIEVLEAHLAQIDTHNPELNAVITLDAEHAYERAREADAALARGEVWGPLHGVPFALKDAHATAGMRTTTGFPPLADHVPQEDSAVTARLKQAGGILMGKTNVPVMLADYQTTNPIFGRTKQMLFPSAAKRDKNVDRAYWDDDLVSALLAACDELPAEDRARNRAIIALIYESGLRLDEVCQILDEQCDWADRSARVRGKGRKKRWAFWGENAAAALEAYLAIRRGSAGGSVPVFRGTSRLLTRIELVMHST